MSTSIISLVVETGVCIWGEGDTTNFFSIGLNRNMRVVFFFVVYSGFTSSYPFDRFAFTEPDIIQ